VGGGVRGKWSKKGISPRGHFIEGAPPCFKRDDDAVNDNSIDPCVAPQEKIVKGGGEVKL